MPCYEHKFTVTGRHSFPLDMLRYDCCFPRTVDDAAVIGWTLNTEVRKTETYNVTLLVRNTKRHWQPTEGRWASFSWPVVADSFTSAKMD